MTPRRSCCAAPLEPTEDADCGRRSTRNTSGPPPPSPQDRLVELNQQAADFYTDRYPGSLGRRPTCATGSAPTWPATTGSPSATPPPAGPPSPTTCAASAPPTRRSSPPASAGPPPPAGSSTDSATGSCSPSTGHGRRTIHGFIGRRNPAHDADDGPPRRPEVPQHRRDRPVPQGRAAVRAARRPRRARRRRHPGPGRRPHRRHRRHPRRPTARTSASPRSAPPSPTGQADQLLPLHRPRPARRHSSPPTPTRRTASRRTRLLAAHRPRRQPRPRPHDRRLRPRADCSNATGPPPCATHWPTSSRSPRTLIDARLEQPRRRLHTPAPKAIVDATRAVAEIIGALPPEHWTRAHHHGHAPARHRTRRCPSRGHRRRPCMDQRPAHPRRSAHLPGHPAARPRARAHHGGANAGA